MIRYANPLFKLFVLNLLFFTFFNSSASAQMGGADVRFVSDKSFFVIQFDMQKLYTYEKMGSKNLETIAAFFKKQAKLDLMAMKTLTIQFCEGEDATEFGEDTFGIVMDFSKAVNKEEFLKGMGIEFEDDKINGVAYHRSAESYAPSICFPNDKTIVMGMQAAMEGMIGKKSDDAEIRALLNSADPKAEVKGAFSANEMYRTVLAQIASEIPISPFNIEKVFGQADSAVISGNVKSSTPIYLQVDCKTEDGATELAKRGKFLIDLGKSMIPIGRETMKAQLKEFEGRELTGFEKFQYSNAKMSLKGLDVSERILEASETSSKGKTVFFKVKKMGGVKDLIPMIAEMFKTQFEAVQELQEGLEIPPPELEDGPKKADK